MFEAAFYSVLIITFKNTGWISFLICTEDDKKLAIELLHKAYLIKRNT